MGAYSTVDITRDQAIDYIGRLLDQATNEELSNALFALTENKCLDNYNIVDENEDTDRIAAISLHLDQRHFLPEFN